MSELRLRWEGGRIGKIQVPAFELRTGDYLCLHMPSPFSLEEEARVVAVLTGDRPCPGVQFFGRILWAERPMDRRLGFWERRRRPVEWLSKAARISVEQARTWVIQLGIPTDYPLGSLAGNPRTMLGLAATWAQGADAILFCAAGCDPSGLKAARDAVAARLDRCPAIELSHLVFCNDQPCRECSPTARCLEVARQADPVVTASGSG
jgi:hypothetical protein